MDGNQPSLCALEDMMSTSVKKKVNLAKQEQDSSSRNHLPAIEESSPTKGVSDEDSKDEFYDTERLESLEKSELDSMQDIPLNDTVSHLANTSQEYLPPWKEELECLVQGGVSMALRGELWQAFVGVRARIVETYYQDLLALGTKSSNHTELKSMESEDYGSSINAGIDSAYIREKWRGHIEKDLPRTFPGHPSLDEDGRNALRLLLKAEESRLLRSLKFYLTKRPEEN